MIVLGFSGIENGEFYRRRYGLRFVGHDAAVALVVDGKVVFAAEEERFTREKHTSRLPVNAVREALRHAGIGLDGVDRLAYTWRVTPAKYLHMCLQHVPNVTPRHALSLVCAGLRVVRDLMWAGGVSRRLSAALGTAVPRCTGVEHHLGHAATAYFPSPFERAAVLTIDGQGEDESASLSEWEGTRHRPLARVPSPHSIGILYGMVTDFLGMRAGWDEYKVMAMSGEGDPARFRASFARLVRLEPRGQYRTWRTAMVFQPGYCARFLTEVFGLRPRDPGSALEPVHFDLAASLQETTERVVFHLLARLRELSRAKDLCLAGGVALNSVLNGKILASGLFDRVFVPPVPGDHGGALGAALLVEHRLTGRSRGDVGFTPFCGPSLSPAEIDSALAEQKERVTWRQPADLQACVASLLAEERLLACARGEMEYGPRALGHRSLLASPIHARMRDHINARVKHREMFRPFAAVAPLERAAELFELEGESPFMQFVVPVREAWRKRLGAVQHHGRTRVQTVTRESDPFLHETLLAFADRTGVPALLNTSFNDAEEPIVCTAREAVASFLSTGVDALVLGSCLVTARGSPRGSS
jgi:carbamoyltransferase